jgi:hypothetical protein
MVHRTLPPPIHCNAPGADALSRRYYYLYLPDHLATADERERLDALLLDWRNRAAPTSMK